MKPLSRLPKSWWVMLAALLAVLALQAANWIFGWQLDWLFLVLLVVVLLANVYTFVMLSRTAAATHDRSGGADNGNQ